MKELTHTDCGGELGITHVYSDERYKVVELTCLKCKKEIAYEEFP